MLVVDARGGGRQVVLAQTFGTGAVPDRLLAPAQEVTSSPVPVGTAQGALARVIDEDGAIAFQVTWVQAGRSMLLRSRGSVEELLRMARSTREAP